MFPHDPQSTILDLRSSIFGFISTAHLAVFDDEIFDQLALGLFHYQFQHNPIYKRFCVQTAPNRIPPRHWRDIPAVTASAFKHAVLACFPPGEAGAIFHTSGTTAQRSGKHYFHTLKFYHAALLRSLRAYCLPDRDRMRMLFLGPVAEYFAHSSLGYMFSAVRDEFGKEGSAAFVTADKLLLPEFFHTAKQMIQAHEPVFILGTAFNLLECMDELQAHGQTLPLPAGSRILDTGGYKGRTREVPREEFQARLCECFGVTKEFLLNEYGMTELSSQFYESQLLGRPLHDDRPGIKFMPPWVRVVAVHPGTLQLLPAGEIGMLRIFDLANVDSVLAIQTEDLGRAWQDRIELTGRATGAELRGCSLLTEMIVQQA